MKHGTHSAYMNRGCRCAQCRGAHNRYVREYRQRKLIGTCPTPGCGFVVSKAEGTGYCVQCSFRRRRSSGQYDGDNAVGRTPADGADA